MTGFLFLLAAVAIVAMVATLRELPLDGLRPRPTDERLRALLLDREHTPTDPRHA